MLADDTLEKIIFKISGHNQISIKKTTPVIMPPIIAFFTAPSAELKTRKKNKNKVEIRRKTNMTNNARGSRTIPLIRN